MQSDSVNKRATTGNRASVETISEHLEALRKRLIDISNRNKLVNFRPTKRSCIEIAFPNVNVLHVALTEEDRELRLEAGIDFVVDGERRKQKKQGSSAETVEVSQFEAQTALGRNRLVCRHDEAALEARADHIRKEAKAISDETGINHLYLALGFLRWRESDNSEEERKSPLLLIPVILSKGVVTGQGGNRHFTVEHDGGELFPNLSLIERLREDFGLELPRFAADFVEADEYLAEIDKSIRGRDGWAVEISGYIGFFSFAKLRMYIDLDSSIWPEGRGLLEHPLVQQVLEGSLTEHDQDCFGEVEVTDDHPTAHDIPLVVEADSSQHIAVLKTWENKSLVIEGPPGTGKSQTITNIIAAALYQGKTVLFVSEKLAALEVVKRNLDNVGLGEFCLELHSHKTRKQEVHSSIQKRIRWTRPASNRFEATLRTWRSHVTHLKQYLEACGRCLGPRTEEVFRVLGRAISLREKPLSANRNPLLRLDMDGEAFEKALACLQEIARHLKNPADFADHPWSGFLCEYARAGDELAIEQEFENLTKALAPALEVSAEFEDVAGPSTCPSPSLVEKLGGPLPAAPDNLLPKVAYNLLHEDNSLALKAAIEHSRAHSDHLRAASQTLSSGAIARGGLGEWLAEASAIAIAQKLGKLPIATLQSKLPSLAEVSSLASTAVQTADAIVNLTLGSASTLYDLERFLDRLRTCGSAPSGIEKLLSAEHRFPNTEMVLAGAKAEADQLLIGQQELESIFESADAPSSYEVQELKKRLRVSGGSWFSFLNGDFRQARKAVNGFLRSKSHFRFPAILEALQRLEDWLKAKEDFSLRPDLKAILGSGFEGIDTPWSALSAAVTWSLAMTREALQWSTIERIAEPDNQRKVREVAARLDTTLQRLQTTAKEAESVLDPIFDGRPIRTIEIEEFDRVAREWSEWLRRTLDSVFPVAINKETTFAELKVAADHLLEAEHLAKDIADDARFKEIAVDQAQGLVSDWERLATTREWVEEIRSLEMPPPLFTWLLTTEINFRLAAVNVTLGKLASIISESTAIIKRLETYGTVQRDWLWGKDGNSWVGRMQRAHSIKAKSHLLQQWALFRKLYLRADKLAARFAVDQVLDGSVPPDQAHEAFDLAVNEFYGYEVLRTFRELETFTHESQEHLLESFRKTDCELLESARAEVGQRAANHRPPQGNGHGPIKTWTEWALLRREGEKQRSHIPIRQLMQRAGRSVVAWKRYLMMSPLSVAQFLDPRCEPFDLVVMDEASQIRPEDALGAVARARQVVVVGDTRQMPPSNYWNRTVNQDDDDDEDDDGNETTGRGVAQDAESILECAKNAFPPAQRLLWHYRSQHESLIRFSNYAYYDEELIVFPAPNDGGGELGIKFRHIPDGRYKAGSGARCNEVEAGTVARAALDHLSQNPSESLLIATFNRPQQELIEELVEKYAKDDPAILELLEEARSHPKEPFVVKNLENVQGDERDVVFVSCTYGPDIKTGVVSQRFGPIAGAGGRRRLNVFFTRAKRRLEIFSSMMHDQILGKPGESSGVNDLRDYLRFAQTGILSDRGQMTHQSPDSYFEEAVMRVIESAGLRAIPQVGVSSYRIDIGVEHPSRPGEFILGIECDGAMYHSSKSARDRDRLRQEVLERRGWKIHRIWSTDWFRQNKAAKEQLLTVLHDLAWEFHLGSTVD